MYIKQLSLILSYFVLPLYSERSVRFYNSHITLNYNIRGVSNKEISKVLNMPLLSDIEEIDEIKKDSAEENYPDLSKHYCYMSKVLTPKMYSDYFDLKTRNGFTFDNVIQTGVDNPGHPYIVNVGAVAGDEESFVLFKDFFDKIVEVRHGFKSNSIQSTDLDASKLINNTLDNNYVISVRVRSGRSVSGFPFSPATNRAKRREVEKIISNTVNQLEGELKGNYYPLSSLTEEETQQLVDDHLLFQKPDSPLLTTAGMARDWPDGRGVFYNEDKNFLVWVNEEDHVRIISMQKGNDIHQVFSRFSKAANEMQRIMLKNGHSFAFDSHFGWLAACPSNLGTGLRASALIKIPLLEKHLRFNEIFKPLRMQRRGTYGVDSESIGGVHDVSNSDRMGFSEVELVNRFICGTTVIIELEKALERGEDISENIDELINGKYSKIC